MWVDTKSDENDNVNRPTAYLDLSVKNAVNRELAKQGWREVTDNPDVLVSYDVLVKRSVEYRSDPVYSRPFTRVYFNPYRLTWGTIYYPSQFIGYEYYRVPVKKGTVTITMADANTDKVVWQRWTTRDLNNSRITENGVTKSPNLLGELYPHFYPNGFPEKKQNINAKPGD